MLVLLALALLGCRGPVDSEEVDLVLEMRWVRTDGDDSWDEARAGLIWQLSNLGALPPSQIDAFLVVDESDADEVVFTVDLAEAGFPEHAEAPLIDAVAPLQGSSERELFGTVDVGRFLMRTLHEPWRYYDIVGTCPTLDDWTARNQSEGARDYAVVESLLTDGQRIVSFNPPPYADVADVGFVVTSGTGSLPDETFVPGEIEAFDLMPNGRQRFAIYDLDGELMPAADADISPAGQPGKCMWCHEGGIMFGVENEPVDGYATYTEYIEVVDAASDILDAHRQGLDTSVDFAEYHVHTWGELLVKEFLLPKPSRVAREWGISETEVEQLVVSHGLTVVEDEEFDRGEVLLRAEVDALLAEREPAYVALEVLEDARELDAHASGLDRRRSFGVHHSRATSPGSEFCFRRETQGDFPDRSRRVLNSIRHMKRES